MSDIPLHLACADYSRLMPLATGEVAPEGIDLKMTMGRGGSWPLRAELLSRVLNTGEFDGGESSMGGHLLRVERGDRSFVALPIFVLRGFSEHDLYVRKDGPVRAPADLIGKRMGLYSWVASGSIWYRHSQVQMGVPLDSVDWVVGDVNMKGETSHNAALPAKVQAAPRFLAEMLAAGEIDAMWSPPRPNGFDGGNGPIVRLFPDYREAEEAYYRETGIFPMMHLVVVRREVWDRNPVIGKALVEAFNRAADAYQASQTGFPDAFPWMEIEQKKARALLGEDAYQHGLTPRNTAAFDVFVQQALDAGIIKRRIDASEYFAEYLAAV